MAPPSPTQFIDAALSCTTPFALSYTDPRQKGLIKNHLRSLLQEFPTLAPSFDTFIHNDGAAVNLLNASGYLHVSHSTPPIPLTIWVHENYPSMAPVVFITSNSTYPIPFNHPFVQPSGATISPYLQTWLYPRCNLCDLVHNLVKLFSIDHPFIHSTASCSTHPYRASKMEAIDRLAGRLHYDMLFLQAKTEEEIEELSALQVEVVKRVDIATSMIIGLQHERTNLKRRVNVLAGEADVLMNWLRVHDPKSVVAVAADELEDAFEADDEESKSVLDLLAADGAMDDLIYALDKAVEEGVLSFELYIRQVRILAREQFFSRAKLVKLKGSNILHWPY
ncbi:hypothetical protein L1049_003803 [Liquidambar formosana]|uniref:Protein ELC-like n=1 Tax=Liquidambar formosana TaxID=63359 RepID=A0AAP0WVG3_LIQFO